MQTPRTLEENEIVKLLKYIKQDHATAKQRTRALRNWCLAVVMVEAGLRVNEARQLKFSHLIFDGKPVHTLIVTADIAKNNKVREIPVSSLLCEAISQLYECNTTNPSEIVHSAAFPSGKSQYFMSSRQIERMIANAGHKSLGKMVNPHMLRHTFASRLMRVTNARTVQMLLGHSNLSSTQIYTHPNGSDLREAIDKVSEKAQSAAAANIL